jgi:hypothetical protein
MSMIKVAKQEATEWCNFRWEQANNARLPRVLLIGDSIAVGYHPVVTTLLGHKAGVDLWATSRGVTDPSFFQELEYILSQPYCYAAIHFNNGLHRTDLSDRVYQEGLAEFVKQLGRLAGRAGLIWASSTPVTSGTEGIEPHPELNPRVVRRNRIAARMMEREHIPVNDLYGLVFGRPGLGSGDGYHFSDQGRQLQGRTIAALLSDALEKTE